MTDEDGHTKPRTELNIFILLNINLLDLINFKSSLYVN